MAVGRSVGDTNGSAGILPYEREKVDNDRPTIGTDRQMEKDTASNFLSENETPFSVT